MNKQELRQKIAELLEQGLSPKEIAFRLNTTKGNVKRYLADHSRYNALYLKHLLALFSGFFIGIIVAYYFNALKFDFSYEIQRAKELGIISITILNGYPKSRDIITYISVLAFPVVGSMSLWLFFTRKQYGQLKEMFYHFHSSYSSNTMGWVICLVTVILCYLVFSFDITMFYRPAFNDYVRAWIFLGEEGQFLEWVQCTLNGGIYGKDYFCLYGPMLIYPLVWAMKLFGTTVLVERLYKYALDLIAYGIVIIFLYKTQKNRVAFLVSSFVYLFAFPALRSFSPNTTNLRFILGVFPLLLVYLYMRTPKNYFLVLAGVIVGQSLLFSQEAGLCSILTLMILFFMKSILARHVFGALREFSLVLLGLLLSLTPVLGYFYVKGALGPFLQNILGYPKLVTLGYGALAFPDFRGFIANPLNGGTLFYFWVIFVYVFSAMYLIPLILIDKLDKDSLLKLSLTIFGVGLFRIALGRSDEYNVFKASHPAFLLCFLYLDGALRGFIRKNFNFLRIGNVIMASGLVVSFVLLFMYSGYLKMNFFNSLYLCLHFNQKFSIVQTGYELPEIKRASVFVDDATASSIKKINTFLSAHTNPGDYIFFFPNEAMYYFLFDKKNPTRYAISYFAITSAQRKEIIEDLEEKKPEYVVYSLKTWRVDNIPEYVQVPEVVRYLQQRYKTILQLGDVLIMKRIDT